MQCVCVFFEEAFSEHWIVNDICWAHKSRQPLEELPGFGDKPENKEVKNNFWSVGERGLDLPFPSCVSFTHGRRKPGAYLCCLWGRLLGREPLWRLSTGLPLPYQLIGLVRGKDCHVETLLYWCQDHTRSQPGRLTPHPTFICPYQAL